MTNPVSADILSQYVARVERLEEEKANIQTDLKDVYAEAKANGFDVKTMKEVVKLRKLNKDELREKEELLDLYKHALGMILEEA